MDRELEEIKQRRKEALSGQNIGQHDEPSRDGQMYERDEIVRSRLTKSALERLGNIRVASPERAERIVMLLSDVIIKYKISSLDDEDFKEILKRIEPQQRDFSITRK